MICSTIIPTVGRSSLSRAVKSVLQQNFEKDEFEVIVVNDSGDSLEPAEWMRSPQVRILHTQRHNRSVARNTGAAIAKGKYLHFLDDDDWMLPEAFQKLWKQSNVDPAGWIHGGFLLVNNEGEPLKEFQPREDGNCFIQMIASEWIPLQSSWIDAKAFFLVGGFAPLSSLEGGYEDIDLARLIAKHYDFARVADIIAAIRYGDTGSTTDYNNLVRQNRRSREKSLSAPDAFQRMWSSAQAESPLSKYWQGRVVYTYWVSLAWNLKQKRLLKAISRLIFSLFALSLSIPILYSSEFWHGALLPHHNRVRVALRDVEHNLYTKTVWER
jgi:glycosyltransferase involved in cell wall biosynthesis